MKAISLVEPRHIEIVDIPEPSLGPEDVLVKLHYVGLCGSDLSAYRGLSPMVSYPRIPGHEISGVIETKGERVPQRLRAGAAVTVSPYTSCGLCPACRAGRANTCQFNQTLGVQRDGALTRWIAVPFSKVFASERLSLQELALVEPLSVGYHAANRGRVSESDTVLVFGCGAIGLGAVAAARRKGATVVAVDIAGPKLQQAASLGAQHLINPAQEDLKARLDELTGGEGPSVAIEAAGLPQTTLQAVEQVAFAGRVVLIGYAKGETPLPTRLIVSKELDVLGSRNALHVFPQVIRMLEKREYPFTDLITCTAPFAEVPALFAEWDAHPTKFTKILVKMETG